MFSQDNRVILSEVEGSSKVPVLRVKDVSVAFGFDKNGNSRDGRSPLQVTDRVSFDIFPGGVGGRVWLRKERDCDEHFALVAVAECKDCERRDFVRCGGE